MKKSTWIAIIAVVVVAIGGGWWVYSQQQSDTQTVTDAKPIGKTATIFLHGYSGGRGSTDYLIAQAEKAGGTKVLTATVAPNGKVTWQGNPHKVKHPLVQVLFTNNKNPDYTVDGQWVDNVAKGLKKDYGVQELNIVAHSMGNLGTMFYAVRNGNDKNVPKLKTYIAMAGHYDGILGRDDQPNRIKLNAAGKPAPMNDTYAELARLRAKFPQNVRVLNIFGNLDNGTNSDGRVSNNSSRSLKYLVGASHAIYSEKEFHGKSAQHSALHGNAKVAKAMVDYLW